MSTRPFASIGAASVAPFDPGAPAMGDGIFGLPHSADEARVVLIPVPWEPTTSYGKGTARGPEAILTGSRQVDLYDRGTGKPYQDGIALLPTDPEIEGWNVEACAASAPVIDAFGEIEGDPHLEAQQGRVNELGDKLNARVAAIARGWIQRGKLVGTIGGDHASPFGAIAAHAERFPGMGVLHLDAHADLRRAYEGFADSHASIMYNVAHRLPSVTRIVQVGIRDFSEDELAVIEGSNGRIATLFDEDLARRMLEGEPFAAIVKPYLEKLPAEVYLSFDIDGLDPALCPHTGTPVPGGLSFQQAVAMLKYVVESGRTIVGFDLCEVAPGPDGDEWDGNVGARLLYKMIGYALLSQRPKSA
ncbi:MAG: agmatinase family protein [Byssovorax sp.]